MALSGQSLTRVLGTTVSSGKFGAGSALRQRFQVFFGAGD